MGISWTRELMSGRNMATVQWRHSHVLVLLLSSRASDWMNSSYRRAQRGRLADGPLLASVCNLTKRAWTCVAPCTETGHMTGGDGRVFIANTMMILFTFTAVRSETAIVLVVRLKQRNKTLQRRSHVKRQHDCCRALRRCDKKKEEKKEEKCTCLDGRCWQISCHS